MVSIITITSKIQCIFIIKAIIIIIIIKGHSLRRACLQPAKAIMHCNYYQLPH